MSAKEVIKLLNCTHTSLHNYVKNGKLKAQKNKDNGYWDYDDSSVYSLYDEMFGKKKLDNMLILGIGNQKYEFKLSREIICDVLDFLNYRLKKEEFLK